MSIYIKDSNLLSDFDSAAKSLWAAQESHPEIIVRHFWDLISHENRPIQRYWQKISSKLLALGSNETDQLIASCIKTTKIFLSHLNALELRIRSQTIEGLIKSIKTGVFDSGLEKKERRLERIHSLKKEILWLIKILKINQTPTITLKDLLGTDRDDVKEESSPSPTKNSGAPASFPGRMWEFFCEKIFGAPPKKALI